jgi:hypothetical protein
VPAGPGPACGATPRAARRHRPACPPSWDPRRTSCTGRSTSGSTSLSRGAGLPEPGRHTLVVWPPVLFPLRPVGRGRAHPRGAGRLAVGCSGWRGASGPARRRCRRRVRRRWSARPGRLQSRRVVAVLSPDPPRHAERFEHTCDALASIRRLGAPIRPMPPG